MTNCTRITYDKSMNTNKHTRTQIHLTKTSRIKMINEPIFKYSRSFIHGFVVFLVTA